MEEVSGPASSLDQCLSAVVDSLSANIALLDGNGIILKTNQAWQRFARDNGMSSGFDCVGLNYLEICDLARAEPEKKAREVAEGIRAVMAERLAEFATDYPCHSPTEKRWFYVRATRFSVPDPVRVVVSHENVTALKLAEEALVEREAELKAHRRNLEDANTALRVLLRQREEDQRDLEKKIHLNIREIVGPFLGKLKHTVLNTQQRAFLETLESNLQEITSPFLQRVGGQSIDLTPREIEVAILVKEGRTTKEIAEMLSISVNAIDFHRKSIRRKFGLNNKKANLRSHLISAAM
ncbi:MAG: LuxR C-terminal-related transcriptional regulator [Syntrophobacteraceae bacterium]